MRSGKGGGDRWYVYFSARYHFPPDPPRSTTNKKLKFSSVCSILSERKVSQDRIHTENSEDGYMPSKL